MAKIVLGTTMSLDGFICDREGQIGRLYADLFAEGAGPARDNPILKDALRDTGAVVMGRRAYDMTPDPDAYADNYEFQVPLFILTHQPPTKHPRENENLTITFVTDGIESAISQAAAAAGNRDVVIIGGANTGQQALRSGLVDELQIDVMPVLFGGGLRMFDNVDMEAVRLEKVKVVEFGMRTHLRFRVIK